MAVGAALAAALLGACGGQLSQADKRVCDDAGRSDAMSVFGDAPVAVNPDIKKQASRIQIGASNASVADAMKSIVKICTDDGYTPKH